MENKNIFLSYAWANSNVADDIDNDFSSVGIQLSRDIRDIAYKSSIKEFIQRIGKHDFVLMIISDEYLRSLNCMYEVTELLNTHEFEKRILPITLTNATIYKPYQRKVYYDHWAEEIKKAEELIRIHLSQDFAEHLQRCKSIYNCMNDFFHKITDLNVLPYEKLRDKKYKPMLDIIGFENEKLLDELFLIQLIKDNQDRELALEEFLKIHPSNKYALIRKAYFAEDAKLFKKAKKYYEDVLAKFPDEVIAHNNIAALLEHKFKDYEKAKLHFEKAIAINPKFANGYYNLANLLKDHFKDFETAKKYYEKAIELNPVHERSFNNLATLLRQHFSDWANAKIYYEKAIEISPGNVEAYKNLACMFADNLQDYVSAKKYYIKAIKVNDNDPFVHFHLGNILVHYFKDYESAKTHYEWAITLDPKYAAAYYDLSFVYHKYLLNDLEAKKNYIIAIKLDPTLKSIDTDDLFGVKD